MMSDAGPEYSLAAEVHDVASDRIVGTAQMLPKLFFAEIAQDRDFPARVGPRDIGQLVQRKAKDAHKAGRGVGSIPNWVRPMASSEQHPTSRRLAAILAADVVGYSRLMGDDEVGTLGTLKTHRRELIDPTIAGHHGRIVKTTGDGLLAEFLKHC